MTLNETIVISLALGAIGYGAGYFSRWWHDKQNPTYLVIYKEELDKLLAGGEVEEID